MLLVLAIPFFAKENTLEVRRLVEQERLSFIESPTGNEESTFTCISSDALTRSTLHKESCRIFLASIEDLGKLGIRQK